MPIRTHRGRAAVYRRIWGAPMRSPRHLAVTVVVAVVLVTGIGFLIPTVFAEEGGTDEGGEFSASAERYDGAGSDTTAASTPEPTRLTAPVRTPTSAAPNPEALDVAGSWARAWVDHSGSDEDWLEGLRPYTTKEYLPVMESVDPDNIGAEEVTGEPEAVNSYTSSVEADVPTDGPTLRITVTDTEDGWRVTRYDRAD
ncbi:hypothetical protein H0B56_20490 [Haloechinothrix sp. YIM 98757]|uniref:Uncharacterized protein n=1 Tax=Haloechinothrix aidingensis TaxID=2752311 RepID=A0A838AF98_9PSEU|nr:hypothetical protein [Haloechinothrix aidingensis]MBA0127932.1 hypothetical protein [Haloechinothrix aidingensis]